MAEPALALDSARIHDAQRFSNQPGKIHIVNRLRLL